MKRSIRICATVCLMLSFTGAVLATPMVTPPPDAPSWWNSDDGQYYAYGWWSEDIIGEDAPISPPDDSNHWASNFLSNTAFVANIGLTNETITIDLDNLFREDLYKKIFVYITGTTVSTVEDVVTNLDTDGGVFTGDQTWSIDGSGNWHYVLEGEIRPQPEYVSLNFTVPGMTDVTGIWAGEICVPEPATMGLLGFGGVALAWFRKRKMK